MITETIKQQGISENSLIVIRELKYDRYVNEDKGMRKMAKKVSMDGLTKISKEPLNQSDHWWSYDGRGKRNVLAAKFASCISHN